MNWFESLALRALESADAETARNLGMRALQTGLIPPPPAVSSERLRITCAGLRLSNPLGLAAGFDKDACAMHRLARMGFGFIEVGAVTPRPQPGNPKPRLFRLREDQAIINRFGFNSEGAEIIARRLSRRPSNPVIGLNLGANRNSSDKLADYLQLIHSCGPFADFVTVNVSSPNTRGLRAFQQQSSLRELLERARNARNSLPNRPGLFLKLAPDLPIDDLHSAAETAMQMQIDAIIATNSLAVNSHSGRYEQELISHHRHEHGGLSGQPIFDISTRTLGEIYHVTDGKIPLIGVGGIASAADAFAKIQAGASALQVYTSIVFHGFSHIVAVLSGLEELLDRHGFESVAAAVGTDNANWRLND
ncbi:MAG: quinone-dependent dihydroorotate dehydrogenase [Rhodobacteraceae bacterium]|nr:quinone-dependent dihydroorotate dehydrogenase [Paracoccaceae bacterium]